jgi:iron complex outermembrane recepter protein
MKHLCILLFFLNTALSLNAQEGKPNGGDRPAIGKIYGKVISDQSGEPIEFATVTLYAQRDSSIATGGITDHKGQFSVSEIKVGAYFVKIDFIGFEPLVIDDVKLSPKGSVERDLGTLSLKSSVFDMDVAEVVEETQFMELEIDRKVFNVADNLTTEGNSANEVLQNIPSVEVDMDGQVSLRGSANVTILIDGRPSGLTGSSRQAILDQIPASSIEKVEVITNPSAKYDPDGMAGIINIVLKKNKLQGFHGNVKIGAGTANSYNGSLGLNYRDPRFNIYSNYNYRYRNSFSTRYTETQNFFNDSSITTTQDSRGNHGGGSHSIQLGTDLYINPKTTLSISGNYSPRADSEQDSVLYSTYDLNAILTDSYRRDSEGAEDEQSYDTKLQFRKEFTDRNHYLDISASHSVYSGDGLNSYLEAYYDVNGEPLDSIPLNEQTRSISESQFWTAQADFQKPMPGKGKLELGYKSTIREMNTDFVAEVYDTDAQDYLNDTLRSNDFDYDEAIHAAYATYGRKFGEFGLQLGARYEMAFTKSVLVNTQEVFQNDYQSFFPSGHLSYKVSDQSSFQVSYSRRIDRPGTRQLNPFPNYSDPLNLRVGNPFLKPEYINSYDLSYVLQWKDNTLTASTYYREVNGVVRYIKTVDQMGFSTTTFENIAGSQSLGIELIAVAKLSKIWSINGSVNGYQSRTDGTNLQSGLTVDAFGWDGKLMSTWKFGKEYEVQLSGFYRAPMLSLQGRFNGMYSTDVAMQKSILDGKGSLSLRLSDIFNTRQFSFETVGENFEQHATRKRQSRILNFTFSYRFGKLEEKNFRRGRGGAGGGDSEGGEMDIG